MGFLIVKDRHGFMNMVSDNNESFYRAFNMKVPESMRLSIVSYQTKEDALAALSGNKKQTVTPVAKNQALKSKKK